MSKNINILDHEYRNWVKTLAARYRSSQIKAAVKVNSEKLFFNWLLGRDIVEMHVEERWGESVIVQLSKDLRSELPGIEGLSKSNIYYCKKFYSLYNQNNTFFQQVVGNIEPKYLNAFSNSDDSILLSEKENSAEFQQLVGIFQIPWGHHCVIMDYVKGNTDKAIFFVRKTIENGWSRAMLLNWIDSGLYEREGKAITNFKVTLPEPMSDLAQEITKDPYNFAFADITGRYNETLLKTQLLKNITDFLIELGTGFAYVGKEYRLQIGEKEKFIDLLFYHLNLRCYVVIEVKMGEFDFQDVGQLGGYVTTVNHILKRGDDNPTIGLLICKNKDNLLAQYALESSSQPIGISDFELEKLYPSKVDGMIPTIKEIEENLNK
ncbi:MAG: PDDEXK nuclease domain-containing protein [Bacteroidales bacterium]|nr:PDDEXK nuclease domain-containing protein [Bacteroidales bacterium]